MNRKLREQIRLMRMEYFKLKQKFLDTNLPFTQKETHRMMALEEILVACEAEKMKRKEKNCVFSLAEAREKKMR